MAPVAMCTPAEVIHMAADIMGILSNPMCTPAEVIPIAAGEVDIPAREVSTSNRDQRRGVGGGVEVGARGAAPRAGYTHALGGGTHTRGGGADRKKDVSPASGPLPLSLRLYEGVGSAADVTPLTPALSRWEREIKY